MVMPSKSAFADEEILLPLTLFHVGGGGGGGGGADSTRPQIVFFITSSRDAAEQQNLATLLDNRILNIKMTMENDFWNTCPKSMKLYFWMALVMSFSKIKLHLIPLRSEILPDDVIITSFSITSIKFLKRK